MSISMPIICLTIVHYFDNRFRLIALVVLISSKAVMSLSNMADKCLGWFLEFVHSFSSFTVIGLGLVEACELFSFV